MSIIGVIVSGIIWKINVDLEKKLNNRDSYYESLVVNMKFSDKYETGLLNIPNNEDPIKVKYKTCDAYSLRGSIKEARVIYYTENNIIVLPSNLLQRDIFEMKQNQNNYAPETIFLRTLYTQDVSASSASNYYSSAYLLLEDYNEKKELFLIAYCFDKEKKISKGQVVLDEFSLLYEGQSISSFGVEDDGLEGEDSDLFNAYLKKELLNYKALRNYLKDAGLF
ncbi:hypothetical protein [Carnobacterium maltaromaticum]|uniref:hypothetical protein n=1 Tax=Carnobacterium maltaromaticum TaxID=2751 RepID=UPI0012FC1045|nr:hypothetical protein [Carnobacterium maltaromaticum]